MIKGGYTGKFLTVDLGTREVGTQIIDDQVEIKGASRPGFSSGPWQPGRGHGPTECIRWWQADSRSKELARCALPM